MPNITISLDKDLIAKGRRYAQKHRTSLNALIRELLETAVTPQNGEWLDDCFHLMDKAEGNSEGRSWRREDLYDV